METREPAIATAQESAPADGHAHRWRIEEARGPVSRGICKTCGAEKDFKNWLGETDFITNEEHRQAA